MLDDAIHTSQVRVQLHQQLEVHVVRLRGLSVAGSGVLLSGVVSTHCVL